MGKHPALGWGMIIFSSVYLGIEPIGLRVKPDTPVIGVDSRFIACSDAPMLGLPPMCGHFFQTASPTVIAQQFHVATPPLFPPRYNIAPSQPIAAIRGDESKGSGVFVVLQR